MRKKGIFVESGRKMHLELVCVWWLGKFYEYGHSWIFLFLIRKIMILDFQMCLTFEYLFLTTEKYKITKQLKAQALDLKHYSTSFWLWDHNLV